MDLSIIIINYNQKNLLKQCWQSIIEAQIKLNYEVIFIDNDSFDGSEEIINEIAERESKARKIINKINLGFAKAVNQGIKQSAGKYILVLNSDIIVLPGSIERMFQFMEANQRCAIAGPKLLNLDKTIQDSVYRFPQWYTPILRRTLLGRFGWGRKQVGQYLMKDWNHQESRIVDWLLGGALMLRRRATEEIGAMDERFFLYFEDVELCRRAKRNNWQVYYVAEAPFYHFHQRSSAEPLALFKKITWIHLSSAIKYFLKKENMAIDVHAHLNFQAFNDDYAAVIKNSHTKGVTKIINIGSNWLTSQKAVQLAKEFDYCFAALGLHPIHVTDEDFSLESYRELIKNNRTFVKAIGETGLDFYQNQNNCERQREVFLKHLELAKEFDLPVVLHCRGEKNEPLKAYEDLLSMIHDAGYTPRGELHCFSANWSIAQQFLDLGFYIGFTGIITYANAGEDLLEVVTKTPLERMLVETDCPYLSPQPVRRERCEPWHVKYTIEKIAEIKKTSVGEVEGATIQNSEKLFNI